MNHRDRTRRRRFDCFSWRFISGIALQAAPKNSMNWAPSGRALRCTRRPPAASCLPAPIVGRASRVDSASLSRRHRANPPRGHARQPTVADRASRRELLDRRWQRHGHRGTRNKVTVACTTTGYTIGGPVTGLSANTNGWASRNRHLPVTKSPWSPPLELAARFRT